MDPIKPIPTYGQEEIKQILGLEVVAPKFTEEEINYWNSVSPFDENKKISEMYKVVLIPGELSINKLIEIFIEKTENKNRIQIVNRFPEHVCKLVGHEKPYWLFLSPEFNQRGIKLAASIEEIEKQTKKTYKVLDSSSRLPSCVEIVFCTLIDSLGKKADFFDKKFILCREEIKSDTELTNISRNFKSPSIYNEISRYSHALGKTAHLAITMMANQQNEVYSKTYKTQSQVDNHITMRGLFENKVSWSKTKNRVVPDQILVWANSK